MDRSVTPELVWKGKTVKLKSILPVNREFGNVRSIKEGTRGIVESAGFESGMLRVKFYEHSGAPPTQFVKFNELSASQYLWTDSAINKHSLYR